MKHKTHKKDESSRATSFSKLYSNNNSNTIFSKKLLSHHLICSYNRHYHPTISFFLYCTYFSPHYFVFSRVHKTIPITLTNNSFLNTRAILNVHNHVPPPLSHTAIPTVLTKYSFPYLSHLTNSSCVKHSMWKGDL